MGSLDDFLIIGKSVHPDLDEHFYLLLGNRD